MAHHLQTTAAYAAVTGLTVSRSLAPDLLTTILLIALILHEAEADLRRRRYSTWLPIFAGLAISYGVLVSGGLTSGALDAVTLLGTAALSSTALIYAVCLSSLLLAEIANKHGQHFVGMMAFPIIWSCAWTFFCHVNALGRLIDWTPSGSASAPLTTYLPAFGLAGLDFFAATAAITLKTYVWPNSLETPDSVALISVDDPTESTALLASRGGAAPRRSNGEMRSLTTGLAAVIFTLLLVPTYLPQDTVHETEATFRAACILRADSGHKAKWPTALDAYIAESDVVAGRGAKVLVWPEGAVYASTAAEKATLLTRTSEVARSRRALIASGYTAPLERDGKREIAVTLLDSQGDNVFTYRKQALIPIAESYAYSPGREALPRATIDVPVPHQSGKKVKEALQLHVSAAICHDTSFSSIVRQAYPSGLILVPSSVFSERLAWQRVRQLQIEAKSLGTAFLVCDGADQGISAYITNNGALRYWQRGGPSFEINIHAHESASTFYGKYGDVGSLGLLLLVVLGMTGAENAWHTIERGVKRMLGEAREVVMSRWRSLTGAVTMPRRRDEANESLI